MPVAPATDEQRAGQIRADAETIVKRDRRIGQPAGRDQHAKHHGCLWAYLDVLPNLPDELRVGLFREQRRYKAWIRFSNSSSIRRKDTAFDGRGCAIKVLEVEGEPSAHAQQQRTQDFILLNHSAFFARDLEELTQIFGWLAQGRSLPWFFVRHLHLRGLWAIWKLATRPNSPLELTYFSQTPFQHGALQVKYRLRCIAGVERKEPTALEKACKNHLHDVMRRQLLPNSTDRKNAQDGNEPSPEQSAGDAVFAFEVQRKQAGDDLERADVSWTGEFEPVALLRIPRQDFDAPERMSFAEHMSFNPWNGLSAHTPLGRLNRARASVYPAIAELRNRLNAARQPSYDAAEWQWLRGRPAGPVRTNEELRDVVERLTPRLASLPLKLFSSRLGALVPLASLTIILSLLYWNPEQVGRPIALDAPLRTFGLSMPSEDLIPPAEYSAKYLATLASKHIAGYRPETDPDDVRWLFRYGSMGAEFSAGIPYWIHRVLPRIAPEQFGGRHDWSEFGLRVAPEDDDYYKSYHRLPRGLVLADTLVRIGNQDFELRLKRVALNCGSCHRGEYADELGNLKFVDGMPNLGFDAAAFKRQTIAALGSPKFTVARVLEEIDRALAEEHAASQRTGAPHRLNAYERFVYTQIVELMQKNARDKAAALAWVDRRPPNGPGRLDAFSALRFEQFGLPDTDPLVIATVDLPSIWQQGPGYRSRHHYDGNTMDARARNVGAIVGAGGHPLSVRFENVAVIAAWIDDRLAPPPFPFAKDKTRVQRGAKTYEAQCAHCHGSYKNGVAFPAPTDCMRKAESKFQNTDDARHRAIDQGFVEKLNAFGVRGGLWSTNSFEVSDGYLCPPLDGIWARAPYLHNGSVPTLDALLGGPRPDAFYRGNPHYDREHGGFVWNVPTTREPFRVKDANGVALRGNSASGHDRGAQTVPDPEARRDLIEFLYSL